MAQQVQAVIIPDVNVKIVTLTLVSLSQLLVNRMTEEVKGTLPGAEKKPTEIKPKKKVYPTAQESFLGSRYLTPDRKEGLPASKFTKALGNVAPLFDKSVSKTMLNKCVSILNGEGPEQIIPFNGITANAIIHEGIERVMGTPVVRYRALYDPWSLDLEIEWNDDVLSLDMITNLINHTGRWIGVGEHCPGSPRGGDNGRFQVKLK